MRLTNEQITVIVVVACSLMLLLRYFVLKTRTGKAMRAVSFNLDAAQLMGISTDRIIVVTFALGSALAAAAGVLIGMQIPKIDPLMGIMPGLKAFVAAVLGGIGNIPGAVLGGLLIGLVGGHGRRLPVLDLPRRHRLRDPDPRPAPAAPGPARARPEEKV